MYDRQNIMNRAWAIMGNRPFHRIIWRNALWQAWDEAKEAVRRANMTEADHGPIYYGIVMFLGGVILSGTAFVFTLIATVGLAIMAAIGPIFICFALFDVTRGWFFSWLGQILNFLIFKLLIYVLSLVIILMLERPCAISARLRSSRLQSASDKSLKH